MLALTILAFLRRKVVARPTFSDVKDEPLPGSAFAAAPSEPSGPGARAPRVLPSELWSEFFSCLSRARCSLSSFIPSGYYLALSEGLSVQAIRAEDGECGRSLYLFPSSFARGPVALQTPRALVSMQLC